MGRTHTWKRGRAAAAAAAFSLLSGCPLSERQLRDEAPAAPTFAQRLQDVEERLPLLDRSNAEALRRLDAVEKAQRGADLAELRNQLEELRKKLALAQGDLEEQSRSLGGRLSVVENRPAAPAEWPRAAEMEKVVADLGLRLQALEAGAGRAAETVASDRAPTPAGKASPAEILYQEAYSLLKKQGKPREAREKFLTFIRNNPDDSYVPNAYFWVAESYFDQEDYEKAVLQYDEVINKFPRSAKVPSALLKEALAFDAMKDRETARAILKKLIKEHPTSEPANIAKKKLETFGD